MIVVTIIILLWELQLHRHHRTMVAHLAINSVAVEMDYIPATLSISSSTWQVPSQTVLENSLVAVMETVMDQTMVTMMAITIVTTVVIGVTTEVEGVIEISDMAPITDRFSRCTAHQISVELNIIQALMFRAPRPRTTQASLKQRTRITRKNRWVSGRWLVTSES